MAATRAAKEGGDGDTDADGDIPSRGDRIVVSVPSRELEEHRRRFETPPIESGEGEEVKGKGKGARGTRSGGGGRDSPFDDAVRSLRESGASVEVREVRDVPSPDVDVEAAEAAATTSPDRPVSDDEGRVDEEASPLHTLGSYLRREAKRGS